MKELDYSIEKKNHNYTLFILVCYMLTVFIYRDFSIPTIVGYVFLIIPLFLALISPNKRFLIDSTRIAVTIMMLFMSFEILRGFISQGESLFLLYVPAFIILILYLFVSNPGDEEMVKSIRIWLIISIIAASYVLLIKLFPGVYYSLVRPLISDYSATMNDSFVSKGYGISLGGNVVLIDYILAFVIILLVNMLIMKDYEKYRSNTGVIICILLVTGLAVVLVNRKSELIALVAACGILFFTNANYDKKSRKIRVLFYIFLALSILAILTIFLYQNGLLGRYGDFIEIILSKIFEGDKRDFSSGRIVLWKIALDLFKNSPVNGIGWGGFSDYVPSYAKAGDVDGFGVRNVHNCYLQLLCETGIVGFTIIVGSLITILLVIKRRNDYIAKHSCSYIARIVGMTCYGYQCFFLIVSFIDPCMYKVVFWFFYVISLIMANWAWIQSRKGADLEDAFIKHISYLFVSKNFQL